MHRIFRSSPDAFHPLQRKSVSAEQQRASAVIICHKASLTRRPDS